VDHGGTYMYSKYLVYYMRLTRVRSIEYSNIPWKIDGSRPRKIVRSRLISDMRVFGFAIPHMYGLTIAVRTYLQSKSVAGS
jgi:hypothetical protein